MTDTAILTLCLLAAMGAECIPLLLALVALAGVLTVWKDIRKPLRCCEHRNGRGGNG